MSDNIAVTPGTGATIAADDIGTVLYQRVKVSLGADGSATDALGGAGAVAAGVQRTTLASDDPAVVALQIIDDWDESDRAKVNPIVGQAGVAAGSGATSATTQRVVLATDSPGVTTAGQAAMAASLPVAIASNQSAVAVAIDTASISNNGTALTPKFATIAASSSGDNAIVSAVASKKIRVLAVQMISNGTVNAKWQSATAGDKTGLAYLVANAGYVLPFCPVGWFETASNEDLQLNLSAAIAVGGSIVYVEV